MHELGTQNQDWKTYAYKGRRDIGLMKKDWPGSEVRAQETIPSHSDHDGCPSKQEWCRHAFNPSTPAAEAGGPL